MNLPRKRKPEVVVFEEPARKQRRKILKKEKEKDKNYNAGNMNFKEIAREVRELGVSGFKKKDQRKYKQQRAEELGAKAPKKQKMPYPLLMELKKIQDEKQSKQRELDVAMGVFKKKKKSDEKSKYLRLKGSGRWVDRSQGLEGGKYKNGIQKIKHKDFAKFTKTKT